MEIRTYTMRSTCALSLTIGLNGHWKHIQHHLNHFFDWPKSKITPPSDLMLHYTKKCPFSWLVQYVWTLNLDLGQTRWDILKNSCRAFLIPMSWRTFSRTLEIIWTWFRLWPKWYMSLLYLDDFNVIMTIKWNLSCHFLA